jgi:hypothetical protein
VIESKEITSDRETSSKNGLRKAGKSLITLKLSIPVKAATNKRNALSNDEEWGLLSRSRRWWFKRIERLRGSANRRKRVELKTTSRTDRHRQALDGPLGN